MKTVLADLSHYEWPADLNAMADSGVVAVIWKATQGSGYQDPTYAKARAAAYAAGLLWGAYHFADASNIDNQVKNFLNYAMPTDDDMMILDCEDNSDNTISLSQAQNWIEQVEEQQGRVNETVLYAGNWIKERLGNKKDPFWAAHRLWLCQYGSTPVVPPCWDKYWLWQFTDGTDGPEPHTIAGVEGACDLNNYDGTAEQLVAEWASGVPVQPLPPSAVVTVTISSPPGVTVNVVQTSNG